MIVASLLSGWWGGLEDAAIATLNVIIAALGAVIAGAIAVLPSMPDPPTAPPFLAQAAQWVAWIWPVGTTLDALAFVSSMYFLFWVVAIGLRWAKALNQ